MTSMRATWFTLFAVVALIFTAVAAWRLLPPPFMGLPGERERSAGAESAVDLDHLRPKVAAFCGDCHGLPLPDSFPRDAWYDEVKRGYDFYFTSGRTDLIPPPLADVVEFYRRQAPESLVLPRPAVAAHARVRWRAAPTAPAPAPATANLRWAALEAGGPKGLLLCDMGAGVVAYRAFADAAPWNVLAKVAHACHAEPADMDGNGEPDLVVSDLGSFLPEDHDRGRVVWLHRDNSGDWISTVLAQGLGRVADARPADFDGDGDQDAVVAEFGWHETGGIHVLENREGEFHLRRLDSRPGAIHVPVCDLNRDGRPDFVALISQQYETIVAFINEGAGQFSQHTLWSAGDPGFGSSGIELIDFDADGDLDVLYTNGDSFDSSYLKPSHGVHWLENRGDLQFVPHRIASLPGVHRAGAGDLDGDGDLDIVASVFLPQFVAATVDPAELDTIVLLEQVEPGIFAYHRLESGMPEHATLELGDFDADGDMDFVAGVQVTPGNKDRSRAVIWWNEESINSTPETRAPRARARPDAIDGPLGRGV